MAAAVSESYFGRCRCCKKETYLKNMWYTVKGQEEVYGQMIVDCFAIDWMIQGDTQDDKICETCISKLRIAVNFKEQVLRCQAGILQSGKVNAIEDTVEDVEEELIEEEEIANFDPEGEEKSIIVNGEQKAYEDVEFLEEEVLDEETNNDDSQDSEPVEKKRKWPKKLPPGERYKQYMQYTEEDLKKAIEAVRTKQMSTVKAAEMFKIPRKTISKRLYDDTDGGHAIDKQPQEDVNRAIKKHRDNIRSILVATNATPIKGHWGFGYACFFCPQQFSDPAQLKKHTFTHGSLIPSIKVKSLTDHIVKLDVTNLKCNICEAKPETLDDLMRHLVDKHRMLMHLDIPNHIVPFSFAGDVLQCVKCPLSFDSFKNLSEHMNDAHYRNYECVVCRRGFVNVRSLKTHSIAHGINIFACTYCPRVFDSKTELGDHEKLHLTNRNRNFSDDKLTIITRQATPKKLPVKAPLARDRFTVRHEIVTNSVKGVSREIVQNFDMLKTDHKCRGCPRVFDSRSDLLYHINSMHKPHKCPICDCTFDFQFKLKKHVLKEHSSGNSYGCSKCAKTYITENLLQEHMVEHDDKEFCCEVCCCEFSKEENYMAHMKNNHGLE